MNSRFGVKHSHCSIKRYGHLGLHSRILIWWSTSHNAYHHVNVISNPLDLDSAFNLRWSALFQAMSAAACFMINGKSIPTHFSYCNYSNYSISSGRDTDFYYNLACITDHFTSESFYLTGIIVICCHIWGHFINTNLALSVTVIKSHLVSQWLTWLLYLMVYLRKYCNFHHPFVDWVPKMWFISSYKDKICT